MKCPICNEVELTGKQKYCSGACRVKASRTKSVTSVTPTVTVDEETVTVPESVTLPLNETDQSLADHAPGYYLFGAESAERRCFFCDKKYTTQLQLNKFCSREHQEALMRRLAGIDKPAKAQA